jgi:uncharacterized protein YkwD
MVRSSQIAVLKCVGFAISMAGLMSCRPQKPELGLGGGNAARMASVSMPLPDKLAPYIKPGKIDGYLLSIIGGTCSNGRASTTLQNKFGVLTTQKVMLTETVASGCAYTFVLSLGRIDDSKTKLEKVYLTNDTPEHRTSMSMDQTKDAKFSVRLVVYLTADGLADLGINDSDLNSLQPAPGPSPAPNPSPNPAPSPAPSPSPNPNPAPNPAPNPNPPTPPVDASCYKGDPRICRIEKLIADQTNTYRQSRGLGALEYDAKLAFVSRDWSRKQSQSGSISHNGFPSARQAVYSREFGANVVMTGENVAYNYCSRQGEDGAARAFSDQWWNSPGHRANMLGRHRGIGVGVVIDSRGRCYGTQIFR